MPILDVNDGLRFTTSQLPISNASGSKNVLERTEGVGPKELSDIDPNLIRLWLRTCEKLHGIECSRREIEPNFSTELEIIVVDVQRKCLAEITTAARYFALSYVWG
jgi:hypothetical protein